MISECLLLVLRLTFVAAFWRPMICPIGYIYTGPACLRCPYPEYGNGCKQRCRCKQTLCSHIKGCKLQDRCPDGFTGKYCDKQCSYPQYGIGCQKSCMCSKQRCNGFTGCQFTKTVIKNPKSHKTNPFSTDESYPHTAKSVDDVNRNARNQTSITPVIPGVNKTESMGEPLQQLGVKDGLNKESNSNLYVFLSEQKWVKLCFVLFGIMLFLLLIAHIVLSIIQCPSGNRN
eukprot:XP_019923081.1 PREDICTED: uncharacterized protein LOC105329137 isoform X2 [Crassostrea gigas]